MKTLREFNDWETSLHFPKDLPALIKQELQIPGLRPMSRCRAQGLQCVLCYSLKIHK